MSIQASGINHIALNVRTLSRAVDFYEQLLGVPPLDLGPGDDAAHAFFDLGYLRLELLESEAVPALAPNDGRLGPFHLCFEVDDINAECRRLAALGVSLNIPYGEFENRALGKIGYVFFRDPDGHDLQLAQTLDAGVRGGASRSA
jgi:catechol 2,3-dioxygenase-like lactoylglutathione lyase family enzyme